MSRLISGLTVGVQCVKNTVLSSLGPRARRTLRGVAQGVREKVSSPPRPVYNLGANQSSSSRRALVSYTTRPFKVRQREALFSRHTAFWRSFELVRILQAMGYIVDVVECTDTEFLPEREYDLFIGHAGHNFEQIAAALPDHATKVYLFTGSHWQVHNQSELERLAAVKARRGVTLPPDRLVTQSEEGAMRAADALLGVGNSVTRSTFAEFPHVYTIPNAIAPDDWYDRTEYDFEAGRRHFLFFSGPGNVHKGLDLLLEAFAQLEDQHLWICTRIEPRFADAYAEELNKRTNIHLLEWTQLRSRKAYKVMQRCNWTILPSCAEGIASSVIECMNQGLIPVVSRTCGVDVDDCGIFLETCTVEEIICTVQKLAQESVSTCERLSREARKTAVTQHSRAACSEKMRTAIESILETRILAK